MINAFDAGYTALPTPFDGKLCNYYVNGETYDVVVESIAGYLARVIKEDRSPGVLVTVIIPKVGYSSTGSYPIENFEFVVVNYDIKYYTFVGGVADINFVEVPFGTFVYIGFASDNTGTNFTLTLNEALPYIAFLLSDKKIPTPVVDNFVGLWYRHKYIKKITAGNGMVFTDIEDEGAITLGNPSTITGQSTNAVATESHSHKLEVTASDVVNVPTTPLVATNVQDALNELALKMPWQTAYDYDILGARNGINMLFTIPHTYYPGTPRVFLNGLRLQKNIGWDYTEGATNQININYPIQQTDLLLIDYIKLN